MKWIDRQNKDFFVKMRHDNNKISRSYFKIVEIDQKFKILGNRILDIGSAPGGWTQYFLEKKRKVQAIDLLPMKISSNDLIFFQKNVFDEDLISLLTPVDLVVSDMAPNITGNKTIDHLQNIALVEQSLEIAKNILIHGGNFVSKIFEGPERINIVKIMNNIFTKVRIFKPKSSRKESREIFLIGQHKI